MSYQIEQTILLRDYLKELPISQAMIKRIKREGDFLVNGKSQTVRCLLQKGDCLEIIFPIENSNIQPENIPLKIIYEDAYYLIIDKEKGKSHVQSYGAAAKYDTPMENPYVIELLKRLGFDTIEDFLEKSDMYNREFK